MAVQLGPFYDDPRYPESGPLDAAFEQLKRLTKLSCWHIAQVESDAMWRIYAELRKGIAILSTEERIWSSLQPYRIKPGYGEEEPWLGRVRYVDLTKERLRVGMEKRFFIKHEAFAFENEFRLAISFRMAEEFGVAVPEEGILVKVDLEKLVEGIVMGPDTSPADVDNVKHLANEVGLGGRVAMSSLLGRPRYH